MPILLAMHYIHIYHLVISGKYPTRNIAGYVLSCRTSDYDNTIDLLTYVLHPDFPVVKSVN